MRFIGAAFALVEAEASRQQFPYWRAGCFCLGKSNQNRSRRHTPVPRTGALAGTASAPAVLSYGYFSLHRQRKATRTRPRSGRVKALAVASAIVAAPAPAVACATPLTFPAVKRAEHRRVAGAKSCPCLSAASLGSAPCRPRSAGHRVGAAGTASGPAVLSFGYFSLHRQRKVTRARPRSGRAKAPAVASTFAAVVALDFKATATTEAGASGQQLPHCRAGYFCLGKSNQNRKRRHSPMRCIGALRFSAIRARRPNSLRSNKGASSALLTCDARLALRRRRASNKSSSNSSNSSNSGASRCHDRRTMATPRWMRSTSPTFTPHTSQARP